MDLEVQTNNMSAFTKRLVMGEDGEPKLIKHLNKKRIDRGKAYGPLGSKYRRFLTKKMARAAKKVKS